MDRLSQGVRRFERYLRRRDHALRDYQHSTMRSVGTFLEDGLQKLKQGECASGAIVMPWGSGKTMVAASIVKATGMRALILSPTIKIALQNHEEFCRWAPEVSTSLYYSKEKDLRGQVVSTTYQSALSLKEMRRLPPDIGIVFYDEAHRSLSKGRSKLHGTLGLFEIGLTATPVYSDTRHIWRHFDNLICEMGLQEGVESGALSSLRGFLIETKVDARLARLRIGQRLNEKAAERYLNVLARNRSARDFYIENFQDFGAVAYCVSIKHADQFAAYLRRSGIKAASVHSGMPVKLREERLRGFEDGHLDVVTSRDVLIEGWDSYRATVELCMRPTYSRVVKGQMAGRVLRPGKQCGYVVDFQDIYRSGQQPLHIWHILDQPEFRQGGLVLAPKKEKEEEDRRLAGGENVRILNTLKVSFDVIKTVSLTSGKKRSKILEEAERNLEIFTRKEDYKGLYRIAIDVRLPMRLRESAGLALLELQKADDEKEQLSERTATRYFGFTSDRLPRSVKTVAWNRMVDIYVTIKDCHKMAFSREVRNKCHPLWLRNKMGELLVNYYERHGTYPSLARMTKHPNIPKWTRKLAEKSLKEAIRIFIEEVPYAQSVHARLFSVARCTDLPEHFRDEAGLRGLKEATVVLHRKHIAQLIARIADSPGYPERTRAAAREALEEAKAQGRIGEQEAKMNSEKTEKEVMAEMKKLVKSGDYQRLHELSFDETLDSDLRDLAIVSIPEAALHLCDAHGGNVTYKMLFDERIPPGMRKEIAFRAIAACERGGDYKRLIRMSNDKRFDDEIRQAARDRINSSAEAVYNADLDIPYHPKDLADISKRRQVDRNLALRCGMKAVKLFIRDGDFRELNSLISTKTFPPEIRQAALDGLDGAYVKHIQTISGYWRSGGSSIWLDDIKGYSENASLSKRVRDEARKALKSLRAGKKSA